MTYKTEVVYNCILYNKGEVPKHKNISLEYDPPYSPGGPPQELEVGAHRMSYLLHGVFLLDPP